MAEQNPENLPHKRYNLLTGEWVLVSPHRTERPWSGQQEKPDKETKARFDPDCYLCPGNKRAGGKINPDYTGTFVFTNDYSALLPDIPKEIGSGADPLLKFTSESGICRVICYNPRHDLTMARMSESQIKDIVATWIKEFIRLREMKDISYIQIFENRGEIMGCSNPHPHGQIWANSSIPTLPEKEDQQQKKYIEHHHNCLLCDYLARELQEKKRILFTNESFVCLVPFWAVWPFEVMILPQRHMESIDQMTEQEQYGLASIMRMLGICYDNLFQTSFPYSMGIHQQPVDGTLHENWHFHIHYYPPLLRSKTVKKHMVGYEMLAMPQRDITPEKAAEMLKSQKKIHYLEEQG